MDVAFGGDPPRRAADPGADIEQMLARLRFQQLDQLLGGDDAAAVEMIEHRQRVDRHRLVRRPQRGDDALGDVGIAVMRCDVGLDSHDLLPRS